MDAARRRASCRSPMRRRAELPLGRLLRLSLFQVSVGMAVVLLNGTLNRVMIVELGVPAWLVALMVSLPLVFAPLRALIGFRSDTHRSVLGWRRVPYIWFGTLLQFGGLAIMPFALHRAVGRRARPAIVGQIGAALAFLLVGAGLHTTQTAGLALATDLAPAESRPRVVAFLYVMLLVGMVASALVFGALLADFSQVRLIQVIQGAALVTMVLNMVALWKQEARNPAAHRGRPRSVPPSAKSWRDFRRERPVEPRLRRGRARHRGLQHAGHPARALWRRDPASDRRRDHRADRALRGRDACGFALAARCSRARRRSLPAGGVRRAGRRSSRSPP